VQQEHLKFVIDLDGYSLLFRPLDSSTELLQFRRVVYTEDAAALFASQIHQALPADETNGLALAVLLQYLFTSDFLICCRGTDAVGVDHYWIRDTDSGKILDFAPPGYDKAQRKVVYEHGEVCDVMEIFECPPALWFDTIVAIQSSASRYEIEEVITLSNRDDSIHLKEKWGMNYLYQLGVFGTFK
jgi:hypothetical protein